MLRNKTKRNVIQVYFFSFFSFFRFFRLIFVSLRFFLLIFAYFTFVFASDFWCFASKWIMWNQAFFFASKRNEIFASISNFASEAKVRAHPTLHSRWDFIPSCNCTLSFIVTIDFFSVNKKEDKIKYNINSQNGTGVELLQHFLLCTQYIIHWRPHENFCRNSISPTSLDFEIGSSYCTLVVSRKITLCNIQREKFLLHTPTF